MRIAKGIKGIRKTLAENKSNWHVWIMRELEGSDGLEADYLDFFGDASLNTIRETFKDHTLFDVTGNGLFFKKEN